MNLATLAVVWSNVSSDRTEPGRRAMEKPTTKKVDLPFRDDAEIAVLIEQFEACQYPYERWTHRAHLAVAVVYLRHYAFDDAVARIRRHIQQYNLTNGDPAGYHETLTLLFMRRVSGDLKNRRSDTTTTIARIVEELFQSFDMRWPLVYYSADRLWSAEARSTWVEPDLKVLDF